MSAYGPTPLTFVFFHKLDEIGNTGQYWRQRLYYVKTKKSSDKMLSPVGIEPESLIASYSKSNPHSLLCQFRLVCEKPYCVLMMMMMMMMAVTDPRGCQGHITPVCPNYFIFMREL